MKKIILVSAFFTMTIAFLTTSVSVKAQSAASAASTTVVTKDNSNTTKSCCKQGTTNACNKSKCDMSKCDKSKCDMSKCASIGKCANSGASCSKNSGSKMGTSNTNAKRSSCCDAMKNKTKSTDTK